MNTEQIYLTSWTVTKTFGKEKGSPSLQKKQTTEVAKNAVTQVFSDAREKEKIRTAEEYWDLLSKKHSIRMMVDIFNRCGNMEAPTRWSWKYIPTGKRFGEVALDIMKEGNLTTKSFIDVGCGVPLIPDFIKDLGCKDVHGLEYNPRIVNMVKSHYPDVALHEDNMLTYQEYGKYDILYTYNPLRDPEDMEKALLIIMNQMKPGAVLYFMKACDCDLFLKNHGFVCQNGRYGIYKFVKPEKDGVWSVFSEEIMLDIPRNKHGKISFIRQIGASLKKIIAEKN